MKTIFSTNVSNMYSFLKGGSENIYVIMLTTLKHGCQPIKKYRASYWGSGGGGGGLKIHYLGSDISFSLHIHHL